MSRLLERALATFGVLAGAPRRRGELAIRLRKLGVTEADVGRVWWWCRKESSTPELLMETWFTGSQQHGLHLAEDLRRANAAEGRRQAKEHGWPW